MCHVIDEREHRKSNLEDPLRTWQTVDRRLVHKKAIADVFLTDSRVLADSEFLIAAQWPRRHWYFGDPAARLEPLLISETLRQVCLYVAFAHLGIPVGAHVLIEQFSVRQSMHRLPSRDPAVVFIEVEVETDRAPHTPRRLVLRTVFRHGDRVVASASGAARAIPPDTFTRLRERRSTTGERRQPGGHRLRIDLSHPVYFDHPTDHVPGLMLVDYALRAPRAANLSGWHAEQFSANFQEFVELDAPAGLRVVSDRRLDRSSHRSTIQIMQFGHPVVEVTAQFGLRDARRR